MALELKPLAAIESIALHPKAVVDKIDPRGVVEKLDPRSLAEKVDARAMVEKLDPRAKKAKARRARGRRNGLLAIIVVLVGAGAVAFVLRYRRNASSGTDTATGTDPNAKYEQPGYEDKSFGQAVNADMDLVDDLVDQENGNTARAEQRFDRESAGAPALRRQARGA